MASTMVFGADSTKAGDELQLSELLDILLQRAGLIASVFFATLFLGVLYAVVATPIYRADALIQVENNKSTTLSGVQEIANALGTGTSPVTGEIEILKSREVILSAIAATQADISISPRYFPIVGAWLARIHDSAEGLAPSRLGLNKYAWGGESVRIQEFVIPAEAYGDSFKLRALEDGFELLDEHAEVLGKAKIGEILSFNSYGQQGKLSLSRFVAHPGTEFELIKISQVAAYREIVPKLSVSESGRQSGIIRIGYQDADVDFAQKLINAIAKAYLTQNVERRSAEADNSLKFLEQQLPQIKKNVERAEDALNNFRTRTNTINVEKSTETLLGQAVEVEKGRLELQLKRDELAQRFKPGHPELKAIEAQLAATDVEARKVNDVIGRLPNAQRDLLRLQRDVEVNNELYTALLNNAQQLKVAKAGTIGNVRIIDFAVKDREAVAPKRGAIAAGAAFLGLLLGVLIAFVLRLLRPTVNDVNEIERATGLVSYAQIPESLSQEKLDSSKRDKAGKQAVVQGRLQILATISPDDPAVESLRSLRTGLAFALLNAEDKNVVITGATAGLGKSFISANLSAVLAAAGKRVLLIETDMRKPQLGAYFGYTNAPGLSDYLAGTIAYEAAVRREQLLDCHIDVLPAGQIPPNPGELLLSPKFPELLAKVQDHYDHIILDSAPVLPVGDTLAVARCAATTFLVIRAEHSTIREVVDATKRIEASGGKVKGFLFNGVKRRRVGYGYSYKYYYGYGDKS